MKSIRTNDEAGLNKALPALREVIDPEIGLNIVDLGLVYELLFQQETIEIICIMTLTTSHCPLGSFITAQVEKGLSTVFPDHQTEVKLTFDPPWSEERLTEPGRLFLNR